MCRIYKDEGKGSYIVCRLYKDEVKVSHIVCRLYKDGGNGSQIVCRLYRDEGKDSHIVRGSSAVERATPGEEVPGSIPAVAARSLQVGSVSV